MMTFESAPLPLKAASATFRRGPFWIAVLAAVFTLPLLYLGGSVTTYRVGLAVDDWPTTFGENMFLYDFWNAPFGVRIEHAHRLYGAAVGLATVLLALWFLVFERRRWMKGLGILAVVAVIVQGVLGGTRVTEVSTFLAAVHGSVGQAFFALMVALCVLTGRDWQSTAEPQPDRDQLRRRALGILLLVPAQIALGSWLRHYGTRPALVSHGAFASVVWLYIVLFSVQIERRRTSLRPLVNPARALAGVATLQIVLGIVSLVSLLPWDGIPRAVTPLQAMVRTGHQTAGALILAATVVVNLRALRHLSPARSGSAPDAEARVIVGTQPAALDWEAVA
jgi:cytochrome c oxidase assembly protein subunit 15